MTPPVAAPTGRRWAYGGALLGGGVSVAANVAHSYVPPGGADAWSPHAGAVIGAVFWPVALLVAVEILARVDWPAARGWLVLRYAGLLPVALVAAAVSYRHLSGLLDYYGEAALTVRLGPLAVDGLMLVATGALIATSVRPDARSLVAAEEPAAAAVATPSIEAVAASSASAPCATGTPRPRAARSGGTGGAVAKIRVRHPEMTTGQIAARLGISDRTVRRHLAATTSGEAVSGAMSESVVGVGRHGRRHASVNGNRTNGTGPSKARGAATGLGTSPRPGSLTTTRAAEENPA
jgi:DNA-binding transcriptional ArsR family regulator